MLRAAILLLTLLAAVPASAAGLLLSKEFHLHDFDDAILRTLGYEDGSVTYFSELGSISQDELNDRNRYEPVRCYPFYVMQDGVIDNTGFNCRTFYCVGYLKGSAVCKDRDGEPYGGVVEINNRLSLVAPKAKPKPFASFLKRDRTHEMEVAIAHWTRVKCVPYFLMEYEVAVGQGYQCEEVGAFPKYSAANLCEEDWRQGDGAEVTCRVNWRADEYERRLQALGNPPEIPVASAASSSSASGQTVTLKTFPDVFEGKYGYTAIVSLATLGVVKGYPDGTFRPYQQINRAEFTRLFMSGLHGLELKDERDCFADVSGEWFADAACAAKRLGWVRGYPDGRFGPGRTITRGEGLKIVMASLAHGMASSAMLPQGVDPDAWFAPYVRKAAEMGILLETSFDGNAEATRADAAVWMYRAAKHRAMALLSASASSSSPSPESSSSVSARSSRSSSTTSSSSSSTTLIFLKPSRRNGALSSSRPSSSSSKMSSIASSMSSESSMSDASSMSSESSSSSSSF